MATVLDQLCGCNMTVNLSIVPEYEVSTLPPLRDFKQIKFLTRSQLASMSS